jgi:amidase
MNVDEYLQHDATALAERVARGEVAPAELLDLALARQQAVHGRLNALSRLMDGEARGLIADGLPEGPSAACPSCSRTGARLGRPAHQLWLPRHAAPGADRACLCGAALPAHGPGGLRQDQPARAGAQGGQRLRAARPGLQPLGPGPHARRLQRWRGRGGGRRHRAHGRGQRRRRLHPHPGGLLRPGGPAALARPGLGGPGIGEVWYGASTEGVLSRSVRDTARALDALQGPEPGDPFVIAPPTEPYAQAWQRPRPAAHRLDHPLAHRHAGAPEAVAAVHDAVALLASLGHELVEAEPAIDGDALARSYLHLYFGQVPALVARARAAGARDGDFEPLTRVLETLGRAVSAGQLTQELWQWNGFGRALADFHARHDLLLTPRWPSRRSATARATRRPGSRPCWTA